MTRQTNAWIDIAARVAAIVLAALPTAAFGLDFPTVVDRIDEVDEVWLAANRVQAAREDLAMSGFAGDIGVSLSPTGTLTTDATGVRSADLGGTVSLSVPLGLREDQMERLERSADDLAAATEDLRAARENAWVKLYTLYQDAWLAQEEMAVLDLELDVARSAYDIARARFEEGDITIAELGASAESLERAQTARDQATLTHRLAWLDLAFTTGIDPAVQQELEPYLELSDDPPKPPELSEWALVNDDGLADQRATIENLEQELAAEATIAQLSSTKLQLSLFDHGLSFSWAPANPALNATYTPPSLALAETSTATRDPVPFSVTLSGTIAISGNRAEGYERARTSVELERAYYELASLEDALDVRIRSAYQQMHRATDAVALAERALETASRNVDMVMARADVGQAGEVELAEARAGVTRAEHNLLAARIAREEAMMAVVQAASYFSQHYPDARTREGDGE